MTKEELENKLIIGAIVKIGEQYSKEHGFEVGEKITLIKGYFDEYNGLYCYTSEAPSIWEENQKEFSSIYHLFGNDFENFLDNQILN